jgi:hypothetical protein
MSDPTPRERAQKEARRRRRLAEIFGDVLPDQTTDDSGETNEPADRRTEEKVREDWLRGQVPPHHG